MGFVTESLRHSDEIKHNSNWSNLPRDIAESILKRLCLPDYLQFGVVCTSWRTIVADAIAIKKCLPAPQFPMMIVRDESVKVFSLTTKKLNHPKRPLYTENQWCLGSIEGWLIMFDSTLLSLAGHNVSIDPYSSPFFFLNPVSDVRVILPLALTIPQHVDSDNCPFDKMVASSSPNCKDCFIAGLFQDFLHLAFCRLADKSWTIIEAEVPNMVFLDIEILNSKLYVLVGHAGEKFIKVYDLQNPNTATVEMLSIPACHQVMIDSIVGNINYISNGPVYYLGKDAVSGELLLIQGLYECAFDIDAKKVNGQASFIQEFIDPPYTKELRLWKYNDSQWIEIDNFGDRLIFLSSKGFTTISITYLPCQELLERNCIYFAHWKNCSSSSSSFSSAELEIGMFSLTDKSMKYFEPTNMNYFSVAAQDMSFQWFLPSLP